MLQHVFISTPATCFFMSTLTTPLQVLPTMSPTTLGLPYPLSVNDIYAILCLHCLLHATYSKQKNLSTKRGKQSDTNDSDI